MLRVKFIVSVFANVYIRVYVDFQKTHYIYLSNILFHIIFCICFEVIKPHTKLLLRKPSLHVL